MHGAVFTDGTLFLELENNTINIQIYVFYRIHRQVLSMVKTLRKYVLI
jgi:hypothetical protein